MPTEPLILSCPRQRAFMRAHLIEDAALWQEVGRALYPSSGWLPGYGDWIAAQAKQFFAWRGRELRAGRDPVRSQGFDRAFENWLDERFPSLAPSEAPPVRATQHADRARRRTMARTDRRAA